MPVSVRTRFDVFKRDSFTCRYCARSSPEVVLELDHVVPVCEGGSDDEMNLVTACWECNRGKGGTPLDSPPLAEDPHERAVLLLERERQLAEYNAVLREINGRVKRDLKQLLEYWRREAGKTLYGVELTGLENALKRYPAETIKWAMTAAARAHKTTSLAYVHACLRNQRASEPSESGNVHASN